MVVTIPATLVRVLTPSVSPNQKSFKVVLVCCSCDPSPHPSLTAFSGSFAFVCSRPLGVPVTSLLFLSMFCTYLSSSPMWLFLSLTHPPFTFGSFSGSFTLSNAQWGGDNELGDDRDRRGQYPLASVSSVSNLIHNPLSALNISHSAHISSTVKFQ